jgi:hypothetical protein
VSSVDPTYPPLNTLKRIGDDLWIIDGPIIRFGMPWPKMPFPTRMTIIRVGGSDLFIHSPTPLPPELGAEIETIGRPRWIVGPNRIHYWWIADWKAAYPDTDVYLAPRIEQQAGGRIDFDFFALDSAGGYPWDREIATLPIAGSFMTEVEFFHRPSRTLILTDLIENFEPRKLDSFVMRWLARLGGVLAPNGRTPRDLRVTFARQRPQFKAAVERMIAWNPDRVILAHGEWYETDATERLRRAFRWILD